MNNIPFNNIYRGAASVLVASVLLFVAGPARAQIAQQPLILPSGWHAVWLEVEPVYPEGNAKAGQAMAPEDVFASQPNVISVLSPKLLSGLAEYFSDGPTNGVTTAYNEEGWSQWHRTGPIPDDLVAMHGNRPYLIQTSGGVFMSVEGRVSFSRPTWTPDRFNLIGFGIDSTVSPTFSAFFSPSGAKHPLEKIYAMNTAGVWSPVSPSATMESGKAYWVFSSGPSDYMGPVAVSFDGVDLGEMKFGGPSDVRPVRNGAANLDLDLEEVTFTNLGNDNVTPRLALSENLEYPSQLPGDLTLYEVHPETNSLAYRRGAVIGANFTFGDGELIASNSTAYLTIGAERNWSAGRADRVHLHRLKTGGGSEFWLPVRVQHNDHQVSGDLQPAVAGQPDPSLTGLWVGEVIADEVTSIVEAGEPVKAAAASAPLRILIHSDSSGVVRLLSQVTLMQAKTADPGVVPDPVLVVDTATIPFYEGIKERHGKQVGVRLETVSYDMPRKLDAASQAELLAETPLANEFAFRAYLEGESSRPEKLAEEYHLSWRLYGLMGSGQTLTTLFTPLTLDPFHRSNPFRHAFHKQHPRGPSITRHLRLIFDDEQTTTGRLNGRFEETIQGLIKTDLVITGRVEMRHVSPVTTLEGVE